MKWSNTISLLSCIHPCIHPCIRLCIHPCIHPLCQIAALSDRTTLADGNTWNTEHIGLVGLMLSAPVDESWLLGRHLADYVLVGASGGCCWWVLVVGDWWWVIGVGDWCWVLVVADWWWVIGVGDWCG